MDILLLIGRILYGSFFIVLGASYIRNSERLSEIVAFKKVPLPLLAIYLAGLLSILGGAGVIMGRYTTYALTAIILVLALSAFRLHDYWNASDSREIATEMALFMRNVALIGATLAMYSILSPWSYSF